MKELNSELISKLVKNNDASRIFVCQHEQIGVIVESFLVLPNVEFLDISHNNFVRLEKSWRMLIPMAYYVNASFNRIRDIDPLALPAVLGALNLISNDFSSLESLSSVLRPVYVLRLNIADKNFTPSFFTSQTTYRNSVIASLPNIWCLDDDFITAEERRNVEVASSSSAIVTSIQENWDTRIFTEKELALLRVIQSLPFGGKANDTMRLDVILEDYLEEARLFNLYRTSTATSMPTINVAQLLRVPHKIRLDLSVMLTVSIFFSLPEKLFKDSLVLLLLQYMNESSIQDLCNLPPFVKTAVVSMIRRICQREVDEIRILQQLLPKPKSHPLLANDQEVLPMASYITSSGFIHLRPFRKFVERPLEKQTNSNSSSSSSSSNDQGKMHDFSELELAILSDLPDVPTRATKAITSSYRDGLSFAARHAIFILGKAPGFPSLIHSFNNMKDQSLYDQLSPLLECAKMSYADLELEFTGPRIDGRGKSIPFDPHAVTTGQPKAKAGIAPRVLKFGVGLPRGNPQELQWLKAPPAGGTYLRYDKNPHQQGGSRKPPRTDHESDDAAMWERLYREGSQTSSATVASLRGHLDDHMQHPPDISVSLTQLTETLSDQVQGEQQQQLSQKSMMMFNDSIISEDSPTDKSHQQQPWSPAKDPAAGGGQGSNALGFTLQEESAVGDESNESTEQEVVAAAAAVSNRQSLTVAFKDEDNNNNNDNNNNDAVKRPPQQQSKLSPGNMSSSSVSVPLLSPVRSVIVHTDDAERKPFFVLSPTASDPATFQPTGSIHHHYQLLPPTEAILSRSLSSSGGRKGIKGELTWEPMNPTQPPVITIGSSDVKGGGLGVLSVLNVMKTSPTPSPAKLYKPKHEVPLPVPSHRVFNIAEARERLLVEMGTLRNVKSLSESRSRDVEIVKKGGGGQSQSLGKAAGKMFVQESPMVGMNNMGAAVTSTSSTSMNFSWSHLVPERVQALRIQQVQDNDLAATRTNYYSYAYPEEYGSNTNVYDRSGMYQQYPGDSSYLDEQQQQYGQPVSPYNEEQEYDEHRLAKIPESDGEEGMVAFHHQALNSAVETLGGLAELFGVEIKTELLSRPQTREGSPPTITSVIANETEMSKVATTSSPVRSRRPIVFDDEDDRSLGSQGSLGSKASHNKLAPMVHSHMVDKPVSVEHVSSSLLSSPIKDIAEVAAGWSLEQVQVKTKQGYKKLYSMEHQAGVEHAPRSINGRPLGQTWYPQYDKHVVRCALPGPIFAPNEPLLSPHRAAFMKKGKGGTATLATHNKHLSRQQLVITADMYEMDHHISSNASQSFSLAASSNSTLPPMILPITKDQFNSATGKREPLTQRSNRSGAISLGTKEVSSGSGVRAKQPSPPRQQRQQSPPPATQNDQRQSSDGLMLRGHNLASDNHVIAAVPVNPTTQSLAGSLDSLTVLKVTSPDLMVPHPLESATSSMVSQGDLTADVPASVPIVVPDNFIYSPPASAKHDRPTSAPPPRSPNRTGNTPLAISGVKLDSPTKPVTTYAFMKGVINQIKRKNHAVARHSVELNRSFKVTIQSAKHRDDAISDKEMSDSEKLLAPKRANLAEKATKGSPNNTTKSATSSRKHFLK